MHELDEWLPTCPRFENILGARLQALTHHWSLTVLPLLDNPVGIMWSMVWHCPHAWSLHKQRQVTLHCARCSFWQLDIQRWQVKIRTNYQTSTDLLLHDNPVWEHARHGMRLPTFLTPVAPMSSQIWGAASWNPLMTYFVLGCRCTHNTGDSLFFPCLAIQLGSGKAWYNTPHMPEACTNRGQSHCTVLAAHSANLTSKGDKACLRLHSPSQFGWGR